MSTHLTIPPPDELRSEIRARASELRALRLLLKLSEAAQAAPIVRTRRQRQGRNSDAGQEVASES
jgi:hypothetical protein